MICLISADGFSIRNMDLKDGLVFLSIRCYIVRRRGKGEMTYACAALSFLHPQGRLWSRKSVKRF